MKPALSGWIVLTLLLSLLPDSVKADQLFRSLLSLPPKLGVTEITHIRVKGESVPSAVNPVSSSFELQGPNGSRQRFQNICCSRPSPDPRISKLIQISTSLGPLTQAQWKELLSSLDFAAKFEVWSRWNDGLKTSEIQKIAEPKPEYPNWVNQKRVDIYRKHSPISILVRNNHLSFELLRSSIPVEGLLAFVVPRLKLSNVYYDNDLGQHVYRDDKLKLAIELLWSRLQDYDANERKELIAKLPNDLQKALTTDSFGLDAETRIEIVDLVQSEARNQVTDFLKDYIVNTPSLRVFLQNFSHSFLHQTQPASQDHPIFAARQVANPDAYMLLCGGNSAEFITQTDLRFLQPNQGTPPHFLVRLSELEEPISFRCGTREFIMQKHVSTSGKDLQFPATFNPSVFLDDDRLDVLVTLSMLPEMSAQSRWMFTKYVEHFAGFELMGGYREVKNTAERVKELLKTTDLFFPVAHQLNLYRMEVAPSPNTQEAVYVKTIDHPLKPDRRLKVYARAILPPESRSPNDQPVTFSQDNVSKILNARNKQLFAMNVSCHSQQALEAWMEAFKKAPKAASNPAMIPIVIGSRRGFQVTTSLQTLGYIDFVAETIDQISRAKPLKDILGSLASERDADSFNARALNLFGINNPLKATRSFEPVSNVDPEARDLYKSQSIQLIVTEKNKALKLAF